MNQLTATSLVSADKATSMEHRYNYNNPFGYSQERLLENGLIKSINNYSYDEFGQISQKNVTGSDIVNSNLNLQYDNNRRIKSIGAGVQNSNYFYTNYSYNKDRLEKVQTNGQQTASTSDSDYALYEYYADGKLKKITYPKLKDNTYLTTEYLYDALGRMTSMSNKKGDKILSKFTYTYDANGNILSINDGQTTKTYTYDKLNRLISIQTPLGKEIVYTYDLRGNRKTSNNSIELSKIQNISYSYDLENKLKAVKKGTETTAMTYYADGYRGKKTTGANSTSYVYNLAGKVVSTEITKNGSTTRDNYVWGPDRVLAGSKVGDEGYYYLYNGHGDVVQIVDRSGNVVNNYKYDEWGNIEVSNETIDNPFKYAGEVYDKETGLYYLRARYYDPSTGRFINEDTVEGQIDNPLSMNLYSYCWNNPLLYTDPFGHSPLSKAVNWYKNVTKSGQADWFLNLTLGATKNNNSKKGTKGIYHIRQDWWQSWKYVGYNHLYDKVFDAATDMQTIWFEFTYNKTQMVFWAWKGDYINLGAGAELGIYYGGGPQWLTGTQYAMPMTLTLYLNGDKLFEWNPTENQWWITGFDPSNQGIKANDLTAVFTIDFSNNTDIYDDFIQSDDYLRNKDKWTPDEDNKYKMTFTY